jgi:hypothetical protein
MPTVTITNTAPGPRGLGLKDGTTVLIDPGTAATVDLDADEVAEIEGAGWWKIEPVDDGDDVNLDDMTVEELRTFAADNGIDLGGAKLKAEILSAIEAALTAPPEPPLVQG